VRDTWLLVGALVSNVIGLAWLAVAMEAHWRQVRGARPLERRMAVRLRILGLSALLLSLFLCLRVDHASMASLVWIMALAAAALIVAFALAWRPQWLSVLVGRSG
jgi:hypothetical protein